LIVGHEKANERADECKNYQRLSAMKITIDVECSPQEARSFLGLPDVTPVNEMMVREVEKQLAGNLEAMDPTEMMKMWMSFGGNMQKQFLDVMTKTAARS
jgi:hypothetical protein